MNGASAEKSAIYAAELWILSTEKPSVSLSRFLKMVTDYDINLLSVRFSDARKAARAIVKHLDTWRSDDEI